MWRVPATAAGPKSESRKVTISSRVAGLSTVRPTYSIGRARGRTTVSGSHIIIIGSGVAGGAVLESQATAASARASRMQGIPRVRDVIQASYYAPGALVGFAATPAGAAVPS